MHFLPRRSNFCRTTSRSIKTKLIGPNLLMFWGFFFVSDNKISIRPGADVTFNSNNQQVSKLSRCIKITLRNQIKLNFGDQIKNIKH